LYIYSNANRSSPVARRYLGGVNPLVSQTTFAYTTWGSYNCVEEPRRVLSHRPHRVVFLASFTHGGCLDNLTTNLIVIVFNHPVLDPASPAIVRLVDDRRSPRIQQFRLVPAPSDAVQLRFGTIRGHVDRRDHGSTEPLPGPLRVFGPARRELTADANGNFVLAHVPTGWYDVTVVRRRGRGCVDTRRAAVLTNATASVHLVCRYRTTHDR
jgi:hypothetical protein